MNKKIINILKAPGFILETCTTHDKERRFP